MSRSTEKNPAGLFNVAGAAYVPEQHGDSYRCYVEDPAPRQPGSGIAASWLVFFALIAAISVFAAEISIFASVGAIEWTDVFPMALG